MRQERIQLVHSMGLIKAGEIWLGLYQYPEYLIGSHGEVLSLLPPYRPRKLKPIRIGNYDGYQLRDWHGKTRKAYRHRLVAEAVYGPCPPGMECRHIDGNKANADFTNLRWGTHTENEADRIRHKTTASGERNPNARLTLSRVAEMRALRASIGIPYKQLAARFGITTMTAWRACARQSWKA